MTKPGKGMGRGKGREPIYDRDFMVRSYGEGAAIIDIAVALGCTEKTVREALKARGVYKPSRGGRPKQEVCRNGHDQKKHRRQDNKGRGFCGKCKTIRDKGYR